MRISILTTTVAVLALVAPAAAQTAKPATKQEPVTHRPPTYSAESRDIFVAVLTGAYAVPAVETPATGTAEVTLAGSRLNYRIHVDSISDVTGAYIHVGRAGQHTPAVADLFEGLKAGAVSGLLAKGALRAGDLHETTMRRLIDALKKDDAYVTVHTRSHPGGELLRGQLRLQPTVASR